MENNFAKYLKIIRKKVGVSQQSLAEFLGVTKQTIHYWEKGLNPPTNIEHLKRIVEKLGLSKEQKNKLYDYAAAYKEDIPLDIKAIILENPETILELRKKYDK